MEDAFSKYFGNKPRTFQLAVARHLLDGRSVILRAPTGAGKTATALFPILFALEENAHFARQLIYSLPLRVLANSLHAEAQKIAKGFRLTLQTGETPADPQFLLGDLIFCTYDQSLSSLLHFPFSLSRRQSNINPGIWVSSYLVFDEIHLMETQRALGTTVEALKWLRSTTSFLLMTATMTDAAIKWIANETGAEVVELTREEMKLMRSRVRIWHHCSQPLNAESIIAQHRDKSIAVFNQVERAQDVFEALNDLKKKEDVRLTNTEIVLVHARFTSADRQAKAELIEKRFGKKQDKVKCILIATQVIEVGLDISCSVLHSELAPANALVQRAGRCARFHGIGNVYVYELPQDKPQPYLPYDAALSERTRSALIRRTRRWKSSAVGFREELKWVRRVHEKPDLAEIDLFKRSNRREQMWETIEAQNDSAYRRLVRDIDAISVILHPSPNHKVWPFTYESFSLSKKAFLGFIHKALKAGRAPTDVRDQDAEEWSGDTEFPDTPDIAWWPQDKAREPDDLYDYPIYEWNPVEKSQDILKAAQIALNPAFASYDSDYGLRLGKPGTWKSRPLPKQSQEEFTGYQRLTYEQHLRKVWSSYHTHFVSKKRLEFAARRLEESLELKSGDVTMLMELAIALHDTAKLTDDWQAKINGYQREIGAMPATPGEWLSHTDSDFNNDLHIEANKKWKRPPHAVEGALASSKVVAAHLQHLPPERRNQLLKAFIAAIATHHSSSADQCCSQTLTDEACKEVVRVASLITGRAIENQHQLLLRQIPKKDRISEQCFPKPQDRLSPGRDSNDKYVYPLYMLLVRTLRLADQHSFEEV